MFNIKSLAQVAAGLTVVAVAAYIGGKIGQSVLKKD